jgi:hypothetical protein
MTDRTTTLKLRPVNHAKGDTNKYCGPSAISAVTGMSSGEAARLLRHVNGSASIKGTYDRDMRSALALCGVRWWMFPEQTEGETLAAWLKATHGKRGGKVLLVIAGHHWQVISGNRFVCGQTKAVVELDHPKVHRRARVSAVYCLDAPKGVTIPAVARKPKLKAPPTSRKAAIDLAKRLGVEIERHTDLDSRPWYVSHPDLIDTPDDPYDGDHYAHSWDEVLWRVHGYADHFDKRGVKWA